MTDHAAPRAFRVGEETVTGERRWRAAFSGEEGFRIESEGGDVAVADGRMVVDCLGDGGVTVWRPRAFPPDVLVEFVATVRAPDDESLRPSGRNLNLFLAAQDPETPLDETPRSGDYGEYHEFPNYVFTLTYHHSRLRRNPGFDLRSELLLGSVPDHTYTVRVLKRDDRIRATVDGRLIHDVIDPDPHSGGWVGLRTWNSLVEYEEWGVYRLV